MRRLLNLDLLKALAIVGVIANHWMTPALKSGTFAAFHAMQAVPVFLILMGYNSKRSFDRRISASPRGSLAGSGYLGRRIRRLLVPFAIAALLGLAGAIWLRLPLTPSPQIALLRLPFGFPGNFFVAASIFLALLAPVAYWAYRKAPGATVAACVALSVAYELFAPFKFAPALYYIYQVNPLRFAGLLALGFWLADDERPVSRRNWFVVPWAIASVAFLAAFHAGEKSSFVGPEYMYNIAAAGWPMLLTAAGLRWLPKTSASPVLNSFGEVGAASYHVFLVQGLWFGGVNTGLVSGTPGWLIASLAICCGLGVLWYRLECWLPRAFSPAEKPLVP